MRNDDKILSWRNLPSLYSRYWKTHRALACAPQVEEYMIRAAKVILESFQVSEQAAGRA